MNDKSCDVWLSHLLCMLIHKKMGKNSGVKCYLHTKKSTCSEAVVKDMLKPICGMESTHTFHYDFAGAPFLEKDGQVTDNAIISISHNKAMTSCAMLLAQEDGRFNNIVGLGVDIASYELTKPIADASVPRRGRLFTQEELNLMAAFPHKAPEEFYTAILSAKESAFKAVSHILRQNIQYLDTKKWIEFRDFEVQNMKFPFSMASAHGESGKMLQRLGLEEIHVAYALGFDGVMTAAIAFG